MKILPKLIGMLSVTPPPPAATTTRRTYGSVKRDTAMQRNRTKARKMGYALHPVGQTFVEVRIKGHSGGVVASMHYGSLPQWLRREI